MTMVSHERSLVKRLEGKPFALLGIDCDHSREEMKKAEEDNKISWRSWYDGDSGPISKKWNIRYLPTIYVLDQHGVIRYKGVQNKELDEAVDELLHETAGSK